MKIIHLGKFGRLEFNKTTEEFNELKYSDKHLLIFECVFIVTILIIYYIGYNGVC